MPDARWQKSAPELIERFDAALPDHPALVRRQMFGYPSAFVNGNYFAGLHEHRVLLRLPGDIHARVPELAEAEHFDPMSSGKGGLREWYEVPAPIAGDRERLAALLASVVEDVAALPPKERQPKVAKVPKGVAPAKRGGGQNPT